MNIEVLLHDQGQTKKYELQVQDKTIYDLVEAERNAEAPKQKSIPVPIKIKDLVTLHNASGIASLERIESMRRSIASGTEIKEGDGLPNCKIVHIEGKYIVFDGHHTALAYLQENRGYIKEVPHIIIQGREGAELPGSVLMPCFGEHASNLTNDAWKTCTINWQNQKSDQVEKRRQQTIQDVMNELFK